MFVRLQLTLFLSLCFFLNGYSEEKNASHTSPKKNDFLAATDWSDGKAEILIYSVQKSYRGDNLNFPAQCLTEKKFLNKKNGVLSHKSGDGLQSIFASSFHFQFNSESLLHSYAISIQMSAEHPMHLLRQETSLQSWSGLSYRLLETEEDKTKFSVFSSGQESDRDVVLDKPGLLTEEMLFTYLRSIPLETGYSEEIWLLDNSFGDKSSANVQYAKLYVLSKTNTVHEILTWLVEVQKADGQKISFWISAEGLHPVVCANLSDKSIWNLETIQRKKYWSW